MTTPKLSIDIAGKRYTRLKSASIDMDIGSIGFEFRADAFVPQTDTFPFKRFQRCSLYYGSERIFAGYLEQPNDGFDEGGSTTEISGASMTMMLAYSGIAPGKRQKSFRGATVLDIISALAGTHGVSVAAQPGWEPGKPLENFRVEAGHAISDAIASAATEGDALVFTANGETLIVGHPVAGPPAYRLPTDKVKVARARVSGQSTELASTYYMIGGGRAQESGRRYVQLDDPTVELQRVVVLHAPRGRGLEGLQRRLERVKRVRDGKSLAVTISIPRWTDEFGQLFRINTRVHLKEDRLRLGPGESVDETLVISRVNLSLSDAGHWATLELRRIDSYLGGTD